MPGLFYSTIFAFGMPEQTFGPVRMGFFLHDREQGGIGGAIVHSPEFYTQRGRGEGVPERRRRPGRGAGPGAGRRGGSDRRNGRSARGMGHMGMFRDSEGNVVALHSTQLSGRPGEQLHCL